MAIFHTGDTPMIEFGIGANKNFDELGFRERQFMASGCIDAPDYLPAGSQVNVTIGDGEVRVVGRSIGRPGR